MKKIKLRIDIITIMALIYIYIPCFLFIALWLKYAIAVPLIGIMLVTFYGVVKEILSDKDENRAETEINMLWLVSIIVLLCATGFICGWSGYGHQTEDWPKHNAIINDLLSRDWPVVYENNGEKALLSYYIGQYLMPTFLGKLLNSSFRTVLSYNWIWSSIGLALVALLFIATSRANSLKKQFVCITILILGGGLMVLQQAIGNTVYPDSISIGLSGWQDYFLTGGLQFRTNFISIRWAFGQTLVPWMIAIILYNYSNKINIYVPLVIPCILFGTFSSVSLIVIAVFFFINYCVTNKNFKLIIKNVFSIWNILSFVSLGLVLILYYLGYILQEKPDVMSFQIMDYSGRNIGIYLIFVLGSFGLYAITMVKEYKKDISFWAVLSIMLALPFVKLGIANDLLMGACIAPSMILYLLIVQWLFKEDKSLNFRKGIMTMLLLIGFIKPCLEIYYCLCNYDYTEYAPNDAYNGTMKNFVDRDNEGIASDLRYNYFTYDADNCMFMKYVGKKPEINYLYGRYEDCWIEMDCKFEIQAKGHEAAELMFYYPEDLLLKGENKVQIFVNEQLQKEISLNGCLTYEKIQIQDNCLNTVRIVSYGWVHENTGRSEDGRLVSTLQVNLE